MSKTKTPLGPHDWRRHPVDCPRCIVYKEKRGWYPMRKHFVRSREQLVTQYELTNKRLARERVKARKKRLKKKGVKKK